MWPILQEFKVRGHYRGQYWDVNNATGNPSNDPFTNFHDGLVDACLRWKPNASKSITAGKTKPLIGHPDSEQLILYGGRA